METILHHPPPVNIELGGKGGDLACLRFTAKLPAGGAGLFPSTVSRSVLVQRWPRESAKPGLIWGSCRREVWSSRLAVSAMQYAQRYDVAQSHGRNIFFREVREKPTLMPADVAARLAFAKTYRLKTKTWWRSQIHGLIGGKRFQVHSNGASRARTARRATYGAYRSPGKGLRSGYVKPKKALKQNTGAAGALGFASHA